MRQINAELLRGHSRAACGTSSFPWKVFRETVISYWQCSIITASMRSSFHVTAMTMVPGSMIDKRPPSYTRGRRRPGAYEQRMQEQPSRMVLPNPALFKAVIKSRFLHFLINPGTRWVASLFNGRLCNGRRRVAKRVKGACRVLRYQQCGHGFCASDEHPTIPQAS